jgi:hypothetical protein
VQPSARETFTPREITAAYKQFEKRGPQYVDAESGLRAAAYRFDERVLLVYQESETDVVVLIHRTAWNRNSRKFISSISHTRGRTGPKGGREALTWCIQGM